MPFFAKTCCEIFFIWVLTFYLQTLTSITIPGNVTRIDHDTFKNCQSLSSITIPDTVTTIGAGAFYNCESLTNITIPNGMARISQNTFRGCRSLNGVIIPNSVSSFGVGAFEGCDPLNTFIVGRDHPYLTTQDGALYNKDKTELVCWPNAPKSVVLPSSVVRIGICAFAESQSLTSITIPDRVTSITKGTFEGCSSLTSVTMPDTVTQIGQDAFKSCKSLTNITIPDGVTAIGDSAFEGCHALTSVTIPNGVTKIEALTFKNCRSLSSIMIPNTVTTIGDGAFEDCRALASITIPENVYSIGSSAFRNCSTLTNVALPNRMWRLDTSLFSGCTSLASITIPDNIHKLANNTFKNCSSLTRCTISLATLVRLKCAELWSAYPIPETESDLKVFLDELHKCPQKAKSAVEQNLMQSPLRTAIKYFEKANRLDEYAAAHNTDADTLRDSILSDFGLDTSGCRSWTLAGKAYTARMEKDLKLTLLDESGKLLKSLPKNGADPEVYNAAKKELSQLKKDLPAAAKLQNKRLLADWLEKRPRSAARWKDTYLVNSLLRHLAKLVVWQQDQQTFLLDDTGVPIDAAGNAVELSNSPIILAHPMELPAAAVKVWQDYFVQNQLSQPFAQMWEPVLDASTIKPDRYQGNTIPLYMLMNKELHGITMEGQNKLKLRDCSADLRLVEGRHDWINNQFEITNFQFDTYTRAVNHIALLFDKGTAESRLLKDDISAVQFLDQFTLAQITELFNKVNEQGGCPNATAALLNYKQQHFPEATEDAFADFVLDW